jgi:hypothetical protein
MECLLERPGKAQNSYVEQAERCLGRYQVGSYGAVDRDRDKPHSLEQDQLFTNRSLSSTSTGGGSAS